MGADVHNMSDEDFLAAGDDVLPDEEEQSTEEEEIEDDTVEEDEVGSKDGEVDDLEDTEEDDETEEVDDTTEDTLDTDETDDEEIDTESQSNDDEDEDSKTEEDTDGDTQKPTYEELATFKATVTKDYKANGKMMPGIKDPEDFIRALSMASNYAQKTTALKPHMGRIKMLKDVSDDELNEMMDFRARNPELIKKAMIEAKIDPISVDLDEESTYTASNHTVSQAEVEFDEVLDGIRDSDSYEKTSTIVTKTWDEKSRQAMLAEPLLIAALNEEMEMGRYDTIQGIIDQDRLLGKNADKSDLELYQEIATTMNTVAKAEAEKPVVEESTKPKVEDPAVKAAKQSAGVAKKKAPKKNPKKHDPALLSDEEFEELLASGAKFIQG